MHKIFASDLDGTLMIPSEFKQEGDIPVDWYNGEPCAYMTPFVYENLPKILDKLIPVTARSVQRYKRIKFFQEHVPEFALCAMGMFFVWKGMANDSWSNSRWLSRSVVPHIKHCSVIDMCYGFLAGCPETKRLRISGHKNDIIFLYAVAKPDMCNKLERKLRSFLFGVDYSRMSDVRTVNYGWDTDFTKSLSQHFTVARDDKKLYVMPKGCNKKDGLYRFVTDWLNEPWRLDLDYNDGRGKWVSPDQPWEDKKTKRKYKIICAGDSEMDEPMYDLADVVLSKANYEKSGSTDRFSDWVLKCALEELK